MRVYSRCSLVQDLLTDKESVFRYHSVFGGKSSLQNAVFMCSKTIIWACSSRKTTKNSGATSNLFCEARKIRKPRRMPWWPGLYLSSSHMECEADHSVGEKKKNFTIKTAVQTMYRQQVSAPRYVSDRNAVICSGVQMCTLWSRSEYVSTGYDIRRLEAGAVQDHWFPNQSNCRTCTRSTKWESIRIDVVHAGVHFFLYYRRSQL